MMKGRGKNERATVPTEAAFFSPYYLINRTKALNPILALVSEPF